MINQTHIEEMKKEIQILSKNLGKEKLRILLQIPEGLKPEITILIDSLSECCDIILSADPCYGACDLRCKEAIMLNCDAILHIGHTKFYRDIQCEMPIIYFPLTIDVEIPKKELEKIPFKKIGLLATVQHVGSLERIKASLEEIKKEVVIGGEILGCWTANAKRIEGDVECFLLVASGKFHAIGLKTEKPVYIFDPERSSVEEINKSEEIKRMKVAYATLEKLREAKKVGILLSRKPGQFYNDWTSIKEMLEKMNKKVYIMIMDRITNDKLLGIDVDCFINTACPRITEDTFDKPIINIEDVVKFLPIK